MKNIPAKIQQQNAIAMSLLNYLLSDPLLKTLIHKFGSELARNILQPLIKKVEETHELDSLDEKYKQTLHHLMLQHSYKGRQFDGLRMTTSWESLNNKEGALSLLHEMNGLLADINQCTTLKRLANYLKVMYDISAAFVQEMSGDAVFDLLKLIIMPTAAEYESRIAFTEVGDKRKHYATTFGLFTAPRDLIDETQLSEQTPVAAARITGKSLFKKISTSKRYRLAFIDYLLAKERYEEAMKTVMECTEAESHLLNSIQKMINLDIPLNYTSADLEKVDKLARANQTWIEKIANQVKAPLIAGISGSTGRLLLSLIHFKSIQANKTSIDELQMLANCVAAHMVFQGHHSFDEVHEASKRAIDALLITNTLDKEEALKLISDPFYKVGATFLHPSYADKILRDSQEQLPSAIQMPCSY